MSEVHIFDRERAVKMLAWALAESACDSEGYGYGWDADNPAHVERFMPTALRKAERYMTILEVNG